MLKASAPVHTLIIMLSYLLFPHISVAGEASITVHKQEPPLGTEIVHPIDKAVMVYVPAGFFTMGLDEEDANNIAKQLGYDDYKPLWMWESFPKRREYAKGFFIDKYEVTIQRWLLFIKGNPDFKLNRDEISQHFDDRREWVFPVATIEWNEAQQYANWARKMLPTNIQWEKAARGTDGRFFPWGNEFNMDKGHFIRNAKDSNWHTRPTYTRVGRYPQGASPCGAMDMVGNQYEYTCEWVESYPNNPEAEKMLPFTGHRNVCLRGGSWYHGKAGLYASKRFGFPQGQTHYHVGFRTVWEPPSGYFESEEYNDARAAVPERKAELEKLFDAFDRAIAEAMKAAD